MLGSVYIPPGDIQALDLLDKVIGVILSKHNDVIICMDANSRNPLWDLSCIGMNQSQKSIKMGNRLEDILNKYHLQIHNDGSATYHSSNVSTTPDVTLSATLTQYGNVTWSISDDDLGSPHDGIVLQIDRNSHIPTKEVIDWRNFDWEEYTRLTSKELKVVCEKWTEPRDHSVDDMAKDLSILLHKCVQDIASKRVISTHSKPWIDKNLSIQLKKLRHLRRKSRLRKSPRNISEYVKVRDATIEMLNKAEQEWFISECGKLPLVGESGKWKIINRLTNQSKDRGVCPIRKVVNGQSVYLFEDDDILSEMEDYHVHKTQGSASSLLDTQTADSVFSDQQSNSTIYLAMNNDISDFEVKSTFGKGSDTPGPDDISAKNG